MSPFVPYSWPNICLRYLPLPPTTLSPHLQSCTCCPLPPPSGMWVPSPYVPITAWGPASLASAPLADTGRESVASQFTVWKYYGICRFMSPLSPYPPPVSHIPAGDMPISRRSVSTVASLTDFFSPCGGKSQGCGPSVGSPPNYPSQKEGWNEPLPVGNVLALHGVYMVGSLPINNYWVY